MDDCLAHTVDEIKQHEAGRLARLEQDLAELREQIASLQREIDSLERGQSVVKAELSTRLDGELISFRDCCGRAERERLARRLALLQKEAL